ncbi:MAG: hypothetical protein L0Z50_42555, partial [Verrucomicrobiales bacterium]|nr:hypothetical protein [Verrucomicrobiales bacterium]
MLLRLISALSACEEIKCTEVPLLGYGGDAVADGHGGGGSSLHSHMMPAAKPTTPRWLTPALPLLSRGGDFFQAGYF